MYFNTTCTPCTDSMWPSLSQHTDRLKGIVTLLHLSRAASGEYTNLPQEMICNGESLPNVLRLLQLVTLTAGGVPKRYYDALRREILHSYGHQHISTLARLQEAGMHPLPYVFVICKPRSMAMIHD